MEEKESAATATSTVSAVEDAKRRCAALSDRLQRMDKSKLSPSQKTTLSRLIHSELTFLHRLSATSHTSSSPLRFLFCPSFLIDYQFSFFFLLFYCYYRLGKISTACMLKPWNFTWQFQYRSPGGCGARASATVCDWGVARLQAN